MENQMRKLDLFVPWTFDRLVQKNFLIEAFLQIKIESGIVCRVYYRTGDPVTYGAACPPRWWEKVQ